MASNILDLESPAAGITDDLQARAALDPPLFPMRKFSVEEYELIGRHGILGEDDNVELLEGWVVEKMTKNPQHEQVLYRLARALESRLPPDYLLRNQSPVIMVDSVPEPDLAIVRGKLEDFEERHANVSEVHLVIEVADSSLNVDRRKRVLYARGGLCTYWIVNLPERIVEIYTDPLTIDPADYRSRIVLTPNDTVTIRLTDSLTLLIPVSEFLPQKA